MSRFKPVLLATSIAVLLGAVGIARADGVVYEWTDAHGEVHYTDQWVPGAKLVRVQTGHQAASDSSAMQGIQRESDAASAQVKQDQDTQAVQEDEARVRAARCAKEKADYKTLIDSRRIFTTDKNGDRHYLSDEEADAARLKARQAMEADCGSGG